MTATVGSVIAPVRSVVVREHWIETPGRAVGVRPSPALRVSNSFKRASSSTP
jgi:hypothetical protein